MEKKGNKFQETFPLLLAAALGAAMAEMIWEYIPERMTRYMFLAVLAAVFLLLAVWRAGIRRQLRGFSDDLCEILDSLIDGDPGRWPQSYEDSLKAKVGIKPTIRDYGIDETDFLNRLDDMVEQAFDDQCTGANPRYPLMSEIKQMYLNAYYGDSRNG